MKRLFRSRTERKIAGICGGLGEYLELDPTIVRVGAIVLALITAVVPFLVAYVIAWWIVPEQTA